MAFICIDGHEIPLVFLVDNGGCARVLNHFLHVHFKFVEFPIYIEEEKKLESDDLQ